MKKSIKELLNDILSTLVWKEIPLTVTVTTGEQTGFTLKAYRCGNLLQFKLSDIKRMAATAAGANMWAANVSGITEPFESTMTVSYYSGSCIPVYFKYIDSTKMEIYARVIGANLPSGAAATGISVMTRFI